MVSMAGEIGKRLARALKTRTHVRNADLARALGVSPQRLQGWLGRYDPPASYFSRIAEELNISLDWLLGEPVPMETGTGIKPVTRAATRFIPVYGAISAGSPACNEGDIVEWYEMRDWGNDFKRWGRVVSGYSMEPYLLERDLAIFEDQQYEPGHIVHAFNAGDDTVKQFRKIDGQPMLCPTNPEYEAYSAQSWHVKGVCIGYVRKEADGSVTERLYSTGMRPKVFLLKKSLDTLLFIKV